MSDHPPIEWAAFARAELGLAAEDADTISRAASLLARLPDSDHVARRIRDVLRSLAQWGLGPPTLLASLLCSVIQARAPVSDTSRSLRDALRPVLDDAALDDAALARAALAAAWIVPTSRIAQGTVTGTRWDVAQRWDTPPADTAAGPVADTVATRTPRQRRADRLRRLFWLAYHDWQAALIVVADQLAWGDELAASAGSAPLEVLRPWCEETNDVFLPLLEMLGMWDLRREIGDRAFAIQQPAEYALGTDYVDRYRAHHQETFPAIADKVRAALDRQGIAGSVELHVSDLLSVRRAKDRAVRRHERFAVESLLPTLRLNLVVSTAEDCYRALGVIHALWRPVSRLGPVATGGRFYDYIAAPRFNGYRRLITTVLADDPHKGEVVRLLEFSIYTHAMCAVNGGGVAVALGAAAPIGPIRNAWWENDQHREIVRSRPFGENGPQIYVFSPLGEIYDLPERSTPVDFAFGVHSQIGAAATTFWVNGAPVSYDAGLRNGDLVEVEWDAHYSALNPEWEKAAHTAIARVNIRRALTQRRRSPQDGRARIDAILRRELEFCRLSLTPPEIELALTRVAKTFHCPDLYTLYDKVTEGAISPDQVAARAIEAQLVGEIVRHDGTHWPGRVRAAHCCMTRERAPSTLGSTTRVYPGVPIVGRASSSRTQSTLVVHRTECPEAPAPEAAIPLRWRSLAPNREAVEIAITAFDRPHLLEAILDSVYRFYREGGELQAGGGLYLHQVTATVHDDGTATIALVVAAPALDAIRPLEMRLEELKEAGTIRAFQTWHYSSSQRTHLAATDDRKARSPYSLHEVRTEAMFFGRHDELQRLRDHLRDGQKLTILYGLKRIGKTSLLYYLRDHALRGDPDLLPIYVDAQRIAPLTPARILQVLAEKCTSAITEHVGATATRELRLRNHDLRADPFDAFFKWADAARLVLGGCRLVFMIDEFTHVEEAYRDKRLSSDFFTRLRGLISALDDIQWVICIHESIFTALAAARPRSGSWTLRQQGIPVRLSFLEEEAAEHLIRQPMGRFYEYDAAVVRDILGLTAGHPYYLHILCSELASRMRDGARTRVTAADLKAVSAQLSIQDSAYFDHYFDRLPQRHGRVLDAIVRVAPSSAEWLDAEAIAAGLRMREHEPAPGEVDGLLAQLTSLGLLARDGPPHDPRYRIAVGLFHEWLRYHPLTVPGGAAVARRARKRMTTEDDGRR